MKKKKKNVKEKKTRGIELEIKIIKENWKKEGTGGNKNDSN